MNKESFLFEFRNVISYNNIYIRLIQDYMTDEIYQELPANEKEVVNNLKSMELDAIAYANANCRNNLNVYAQIIMDRIRVDELLPYCRIRMNLDKVMASEHGIDLYKRYGYVVSAIFEALLASSRFSTTSPYTDVITAYILCNNDTEARIIKELMSERLIRNMRIIRSLDEIKNKCIIVTPDDNHIEHDKIVDTMKIDITKMWLDK